MAPFAACHLTDSSICISGVDVYVTVLNRSVFNIDLESSFSESVMTKEYLILWQMNVGHVMANEMLTIPVQFWMWKNFFCFDPSSSPLTNTRSTYKLVLGVPSSRSYNSSQQSQSVRLETKSFGSVLEQILF